MDLIPVLLAAVFNVFNGFSQAYDILCVQTDTNSRIMSTSARFLLPVGFTIFIIGWRCCFWADLALIDLRQQGSSLQTSAATRVYRLPTGPMFALTYCPNYMAETVQWVGYSIMLQVSTASLVFVFITVSNLLPRAVKYRQFYQQLAAQKESSKK